MGGASGSCDNHTQKQEHEEGGHRGVNGSNEEPQVSQDSKLQDSQNSVEKNTWNESLSLSRLSPVDPSPGCEADRSTSVTSSLPVSSGEGCVSTPKEDGEVLGTVDSTASPSVGYGGGCEEGEGEKGEEGSKEDETTVPSQEEQMDDTDATLGESELNEEEEERQGNGRGIESPPLSSSTSWQLVCSSNSNTCSTGKSSTATSQLSVRPTPLSGSQLPDSLPDSELPPLVIDIHESQNSQISTTTGDGLTAVAPQLAKACNKAENVEKKQDVDNSAGGGGETSEVRDDGQAEGRDGLIKEAWKQLNSVRSKVPSSPIKSTASQIDSDSESFSLGEEADLHEPSSAFSLHLTQSQATPIKDKTTPTIQQNTIEQTVHEGQKVDVRHSTRDPIATPAADSGKPATGEGHQKEVTVKDDSEGFSIQHDVVRAARPVPTYESVTLEESAPFQSSSLPPSNCPQQTSPLPQQPSCPVSACSQAHSMEVSQTSTSSAGEGIDTVAKSCLV